VRTLADYSAETPAQEGIVIGFGSLPTIKIDEGLKRLAKSFRASMMR
jgi:DNA-binding transcriptional MocR family regulator